jgi:hypothetical protein
MRGFLKLQTWQKWALALVAAIPISVVASSIALMWVADEWSACDIDRGLAPGFELVAVVLPTLALVSLAALATATAIGLRRRWRLWAPVGFTVMAGSLLIAAIAIADCPS